MSKAWLAGSRESEDYVDTEHNPTQVVTLARRDIFYLGAMLARPDHVTYHGLKKPKNALYDAKRLHPGSSFRIFRLCAQVDRNPSS
jgi:hypothetical protein